MMFLRSRIQTGSLPKYVFKPRRRLSFKNPSGRRFNVQKQLKPISVMSREPIVLRIRDYSRPLKHKVKTSSPVKDDRIDLANFFPSDLTMIMPGTPKSKSNPDMIGQVQNSDKILSDLTMQDYESLASGKVLSRAVVDFYLQRQLERASEKEHIHVFSSQFVTTLKNSLTSVQSSSIRCDNFLKQVNLVSKKTLVFPIYEKSQWYLILGIMNLNILETSDDFINPHLASIIVLDGSEGQDHWDTIKILRKFITDVAMKNKNQTCEFKTVPVFHPKVPVPSRWEDSGFHVIHLMEQILRNVQSSIWTRKRSLEHWFKSHCIRSQREAIAKDIRNAHFMAQGGEFPFPDLNFLETLEEEKKVLSNEVFGNSRELMNHNLVVNGMQTQKVQDFE